MITMREAHDGVWLEVFFGDGGSKVNVREIWRGAGRWQELKSRQWLPGRAVVL